MMATRAKNNRAIRRKNFRIDLAVLLAVLAFGVLPPMYGAMIETRFYRDLARLTPFSDVLVTSSEIAPGGAELSGSMRKIRCVFDGLTGYVILGNGSALRVPVDTSAEDLATGVSGDRPAIPAAQKWGPWLLVYERPGRPPLRWLIFAHHRDCPTGQSQQVNLFAEGPWPAPPE